MSHRVGVAETVRILVYLWRFFPHREKYWRFLATADRFWRLLRPGNRDFRLLVARDLARFVLHKARPVQGETRARAEAAVAWLLRAQDATPDDGVSLGYFPCTATEYDGWRPSYPETTGYIIQTLIDYAQTFGCADVLDRARAMSAWEARVQMPSGAVQGGPVCVPERQRAAAFNTGMVLQGLTAVLGAGGADGVDVAARRAADFLMGDLDAHGHFRSHGPFVTPHPFKTYSCLCAWALYRFGENSGERAYGEAAVRVIEGALCHQTENGWIRWNCLDRPSTPLLHTIAYALQGILEVGILAGREDFVSAAARGARPLLERVDERGFLQGRFFSDWAPAAFSSCLTGNAQLAVIFFRLTEHTAEPEWSEGANRLTDFLKGLQVLDSPNPAVQGAIAGSHPIVGSYQPFGYPSWATKYFVDALMLQHRGQGNS